MLRVGLTGGLGSGKSTVLGMLGAMGAHVFSSDEMARAMMQPGQAVYEAIVKSFPPSIVTAEGALNRRELARLAFEEGRVEELNNIVHPAVIAEQARRIAAVEREHPHAIAIVESALIFTTRHAEAGTPWRERFDCIVLVTAPLEVQVRRFVERASAGKELSEEEHASLTADAHRRLAAQAATSEHAAECFVISNDGDLLALERQADLCWRELQRREHALHGASR